jgi:rhodanese-related sulfurtransferase
MIGKVNLISNKVLVIITALFISIISGCSFANAGKIDPSGRSYQADAVTSGPRPAKQSQAISEGYRAVCYDGAVFLAVGTNGRIDRIKPDKTVINSASGTEACLNGAASMDGIDVAVGDGGVIVAAKDGGDFRKVKSGTVRSLYSVTTFNGSFWAAGAGGTLLHSSDGEHWKSMKTGIKNTILSIAANEKMCMAVAGEGLILMSADGKKWDVLDYNEFYKGCSQPCIFRNVSACSDTFFITGAYQNYPDTPAILSSETGEIWQEHIFGRINEEPAEEYYPLVINAVAVDWDQLVAACNGGKLLTVTECITCNKLDDLCGQNINDIVSADGLLALVGDGFWFDIRKSNAFRQYGISAQQALKEYNNGAFIVDVRTDDEYDRLHIAGSIHIPVDELESRLEYEIPYKDRKVIFYCQRGARAQTALQKALLMGYSKVYNLGGIGDWPYDTEAGGIADADR